MFLHDSENQIDFQNVLKVQHLFNECFKSPTNSEFTSWDRAKMDTILINRLLFKQMCQIIELSADFMIFSLHMSTQKCHAAFAFEVFWGNKQILLENRDKHRQKGLKFTLYSAIKLEEKKTRNSGVSMKELQTSRRNPSLLEGQVNSPSQN